jgi:hypothetical protein
MKKWIAQILKNTSKFHNFIVQTIFRVIIMIGLNIKSGYKISAMKHFRAYKLNYKKEFGIEIEEDLSSIFGKMNL